MSQFKKGDAVRQIMPAAITGSVVGFHADPDTGDMQIQVDFVSAAGEPQTRYFLPEQIEAA